MSLSTPKYVENYNSENSSNELSRIKKEAFTYEPHLIEGFTGDLTLKLGIYFRELHWNLQNHHDIDEEGNPVKTMLSAVVNVKGKHYLVTLSSGSVPEGYHHIMRKILEPYKGNNEDSTGNVSESTFKNGGKLSTMIVGYHNNRSKVVEQWVGFANRGNILNLNEYEQLIYQKTKPKGINELHFSTPDQSDFDSQTIETILSILDKQEGFNAAGELKTASKASLFNDKTMLRVVSLNVNSSVFGRKFTTWFQLFLTSLDGESYRTFDKVLNEKALVGVDEGKFSTYKASTKKQVNCSTCRFSDGKTINGTKYFTCTKFSDIEVDKKNVCNGWGQNVAQNEHVSCPGNKFYDNKIELFNDRFEFTHKNQDGTSQSFKCLLKISWLKSPENTTLRYFNLGDMEKTRGINGGCVFSETLFKSLNRGGRRLGLDPIAVLENKNDEFREIVYKLTNWGSDYSLDFKKGNAFFDVFIEDITHKDKFGEEDNPSLFFPNSAFYYPNKTNITNFFKWLKDSVCKEIKNKNHDKLLDYVNKNLKKKCSNEYISFDGVGTGNTKVKKRKPGVGGGGGSRKETTVDWFYLSEDGNYHPLTNCHSVLTPKNEPVTIVVAGRYKELVGNEYIKGEYINSLEDVLPNEYRNDSNSNVYNYACAGKSRLQASNIIHNHIKDADNKSMPFFKVTIPSLSRLMNMAGVLKGETAKYAPIVIEDWKEFDKFERFPRKGNRFQDTSRIDPKKFDFPKLNLQDKPHLPPIDDEEDGDDDKGSGTNPGSSKFNYFDENDNGLIVCGFEQTNPKLNTTEPIIHNHFRKDIINNFSDDVKKTEDAFRELILNIENVYYAFESITKDPDPLMNYFKYEDMEDFDKCQTSKELLLLGVNRAVIGYVKKYIDTFYGGDKKNDDYQNALIELDEYSKRFILADKKVPLTAI